MPFLVFRRDRLQSPSGIICGLHRGSFAVPIEDHLRFGIISDLGIFCSVVQTHESTYVDPILKSVGKHFFKGKLFNLISNHSDISAITIRVI